MAKPQVLKDFLLLSRRSFAVATENTGTQPAAALTSMRKAKDVKVDEVAASQKQNFWMRDPKSGNWIPEAHFDEIDAAELRNKFLSRKEPS